MRKKKSLNYKQAIEKCRQYQHLVGQPFEKGMSSAGTIKHVIIAPHSKILQWQFLSNFLGGMDVDKALGICRDGKYTVLLVSNLYRPGQESVPPKYLHNYLEETTEEVMIPIAVAV
jgi:hypothetical protein